MSIAPQKKYIHEFYEKADVAIKVPLAILELITRIDMDDLGNFENKLTMVKANLNHYWKTFEGLEKNILPLIEIMQPTQILWKIKS